MAHPREGVDPFGEDRDGEVAFPRSDDEAPLVLSTIHSAKGLEFRAVFVIHALEGVLPSAYAVGSDEDLDEELRLLYVAVTRAADHLFISWPMAEPVFRLRVRKGK